MLARRALLFDFYAGALSEHQRRAFQLHHLEDLSLAECAEELSCSRPAALALVRRAEQAMERLEGAIGAIAERERELEAWHAVAVALAARDLGRAEARTAARLGELEADV